jgi:hypothetical protein
MFQAILIVGLINGLFSPIHHLVQQLVLINILILPGLAAGSGGSWLLQVIVPHLASLIVAFGTIFLSGVPAAIYERAVGLRASDQTSMMIWLAGTLFLSLPALRWLI